jgi:hypothetical protein
MSSRTAKGIAIAASALVIAGLVALAAPTVSATIAHLTPTPAPVAVPDTRPTPAATDTVDEAKPALELSPAQSDGAGDCTGVTSYRMGSEDGVAWTATRVGADPVDMGSRDGAAGTVEADAEGPVSYTVVAGDIPAIIGERFCTEWSGLLGFNHILNGLQPGDILAFRVGDGRWTPAE